MHLLRDCGPALPGEGERVQVHLPDHGHHQQRPHDGGHDRGQGLSPGGAEGSVPVKSVLTTSRPRAVCVRVGAGGSATPLRDGRGPGGAVAAERGRAGTARAPCAVTALPVARARWRRPPRRPRRRSRPRWAARAAGSALPLAGGGWGGGGGAARVAVMGGAAVARQPISAAVRGVRIGGAAAMERGGARKSEVLAAEAVTCLNRAMAALRDIWEEIGIPEEQRLERTDTVRKHIKSLLDMMVAEEESLKERLLKSIVLCRKELDTLCRELQLGPFETEEESTILQMEKNLRTCVEVLQKQKRDRKQELKALQEQDRALCDILCTPLFNIDPNSVPSLEDLDRYRRHVASLNTLKEQRREEFVSNKRQIILLMEELDHTPDTSFERDVVCEDEKVFCLSKDNIMALQQLLQQLEAQRALNEAVCTELRARIVALWERLQIPEEERESSAVHLSWSRVKTRRALQQEVDRLEELKLQNMKSVIQAIRAELADYWDKCFYSQEQRENFSPYYDEDYTETLLELHDAEVGKMKMYYETHKDLFEAVQKWEENWKLFLELESKAADPSRFTNRGGNLLKEEKQRAKLQKTLSRVGPAVGKDLWSQ
ncbi:hypothetical protein Nmel_013781 [Mimus melanotis]